jgi:hypothetical protein
MIAEASKEQYRGVLCIHCRQPIPLSASQVRKQKEMGESEPTEVTELRSSSFNLRCRACHGEATYNPADTIDCDGAPRVRNTARRNPLLRPEPKNLSRAANG